MLTKTLARRDRREMTIIVRSSVERVMGIEPTSSAWEAEVMPLYDTRLIRRFYLMWLDGSLNVGDFHLRMK